MNSTHYVGLDVHKKTITYCLRQADGTIVQEGTIASTPQALTGLLEWLSSAVGSWFGSHAFQRLDLRSYSRARRIGEGGAFNDAKGDRGRQAKERPRKRVVDVEFALWTWYRLAYHGSQEEKKKHRKKVFGDRWVQERKANRIAKSLGAMGKLDLARHYLDTEPTVAAMIAWRELETKMRRILDDRSKSDFGVLLERLPPSSFPRNRTKDDLRSLWSRRNSVLHEGEEIAEERAIGNANATKILNGVVEFIEKNIPESRT